MADTIRATPRNPVLGLFSDITQGGLDYLRDPRFRQSMMQLPAPVRPFGMGAVALPGLFESTGLPKTLERASYGQPLTNIGMANVPLLKPETADLLMNVAPFAPAALRGAAATARFVAPKAGQLAEGYMQRMGMMPGIVPNEGGLLTPSVKPQAPVSDLGFYSAAEQAALNLQRNKGTGQSFINDLMKAPDVKKEELAWTGLDEFLANKPNVTKQEVQDYLAGNRVDLQEVQLGGQASTQHKENLQKALDSLNTQEVYLNSVLPTNVSQLDRANLPFWAEAASRGDSYEMAKIDKLNLSPEVKQEVMNLGSKQNLYSDLFNTKTIKPSKFDSYTLPGGDNYREILLTLPNKPMEASKAAENYYTQFVKRGGEPEWSQLNPARQQEITNSMPAQARNASAAPEYRSSHFNQPNILAHIRVNDRIDADGKKMLLIEELQSDWHQAGREKGYKGKGTLKELPDNYFVQELKTIDGDTMYVVRDNSNPSVIINKDYNRQSAINGVINELNASSAGGVPDAPFKDTWHQLALKRALKYAADNGYERVGLTTGAQQAKRYDLSKQVDEIAVPMVNADGSRSVRIDPTDGTSIKLMVESNGVVTGYGSGSTQFSGKKLDEVLGKEIADKVMNAQASAKFSGLDLQVGGEGMKKYYDEIYPAFLAKQGKKFNAKTGETTIGKKGTTEKAGKSYYQTPDTKATVRYIDISPEMKGGVSKGQPMFAAAPIAGVGLGAGQQQQPADILTNELDYPSNPMYTDPLGYSIR